MVGVFGVKPTDVFAVFSDSDGVAASERKAPQNERQPGLLAIRDVNASAHNVISISAGSDSVAVDVLAPLDPNSVLSSSQCDGSFGKDEAVPLISVDIRPAIKSFLPPWLLGQKFTLCRRVALVVLESLRDSDHLCANDVISRCDREVDIDKWPYEDILTKRMSDHLVRLDLKLIFFVHLINCCPFMSGKLADTEAISEAKLGESGGEVATGSRTRCRVF